MHKAVQRQKSMPFAIIEYSTFGKESHQRDIVNSFAPLHAVYRTGGD